MSPGGRRTKRAPCSPVKLRRVRNKPYYWLVLCLVVVKRFGYPCGPQSSTGWALALLTGLTMPDWCVGEGSKDKPALCSFNWGLDMGPATPPCKQLLLPNQDVNKASRQLVLVLQTQCTLFLYFTLFAQLCLVISIHESGISIPLSLLMLLG